MNDLSAIRPATREFLGANHQNFIDGQWCPAISGKTLEVVDPATGEVVSRVPDSDAADVNVAVAAARTTFEQRNWQTMKPAARERLLHRLADLMEANIDVLAELESIDNGKSAVVAGAVDLACAVDCLRFTAGMPSKLNGSTLKPSAPFLPDGELFAYANHIPIGVVGAIVPWNFPTLLLTWKIAPALAAGCTVVLKPAEEIFGPVLVASPYDDIEEVIAQANDTPYGLGASIWSRDVSAVHKIAPRIRAGTVWVNCHNIIDAALPFGGFKESGWGRENGVDAVKAYTETQTVVLSL